MDNYNPSYDPFSEAYTTEGKSHFNLMLFVGGLIGAVLGFVIGEILLAYLNGKIPDILLVGIYFAQFALLIFLAVFFCEMIDPRLNSRFWTNEHWFDSLKRLPVLSIVAFFVLGCILQFFYGLSPHAVTMQKADDYIFAIDNSGSTASSDPQKERFSSVISFINNLDEYNNAAVIVFSDTADTVVRYGKVDEQFKRKVAQALSALNSDGSTNIQDALEKAAQMLPDQTRKAMVILLSDGESSVDVRSVTDTYNQNNIVLNTVGYSFNRFMGTRLLVKLSSTTGGLNYNVDEMSQLSGTLNKILTQQQRGRMLLDYRYGFDRDSVLFMILRILFITIIGVALCLALGVMLYNGAVIRQLLIQKGITGLLAGLVLEFGFYNFLPELFTRFLTALLLGILVTFFKSRIPLSPGGMGYSLNRSDSAAGTYAGFDKSAW